MKKLKKIKVIKKNSDLYWWYNEHVGEKFKIIDITKDSVHVIAPSTIKLKTIDYCQIYLKDTNYNQLIRKEKLKKLRNENK